MQNHSGPTHQRAMAEHRQGHDSSFKGGEGVAGAACLSPGNMTESPATPGGRSHPALLGALVRLNSAETLPAGCACHVSITLPLCLHLCVLTPSASPGLCSVTNPNEKTSPSVRPLHTPAPHLHVSQKQSVHSPAAPRNAVLHTEGDAQAGPRALRPSACRALCFN